ncbi:ribonuclease HII [Marinoscillum sp. MHG1-6]|uniref:ribonuclease HII n=1 Tax=Marinoscillum sp. MHG1-6 TaxID=2959627 RepID=UPI00215810B4|nr:ribonuclease HII [Marinoscillum sp. MHG1-6]
MLKSYFDENKIEAGCDEAGRGCLAGPVVASAVILPKDFSDPLLNDSKQLTETQRLGLMEMIKKEAIAYAVAEVSQEVIDEINILNASFLAMNKAVEMLGQQPELLLIDGNRFRTQGDIPYECIIKGDGKYYSIAAASILAKTHRDDLMRAAAEQYPGYGWETNVGYPTVAHRNAIREQGVTPLHRMSFQLLPRQLELFK